MDVQLTAHAHHAVVVKLNAEPLGDLRDSSMERKEEVPTRPVPANG